MATIREMLDKASADLDAIKIRHRIDEVSKELADLKALKIQDDRLRKLELEIEILSRKIGLVQS